MILLVMVFLVSLLVAIYIGFLATKETLKSYENESRILRETIDILRKHGRT